MMNSIVSKSSVCCRAMRRTFATEANGREQQMIQLLKDKLQAAVVDVKDVSGGCGEFYQISVVSPLFKGMPMVKQHRAVNEVLESHIGKMHGLTLKTSAPTMQ